MADKITLRIPAMTVEIDPEKWVRNYGCPIEYVRADALSYFIEQQGLMVPIRDGYVTITKVHHTKASQTELDKTKEY